MLNKIGSAPGYNGKRRRNLSWTDELREEVIAAYEERNPTPENSMEIVKEIAEEFDQSPNGVRMVLSKAGAYVKKAPTASKSKGSSGGTRVSKAAAQESLTKAIQDAGQEADSEIISRLTGKAAAYLASVINAINE
jgi:hypothetical protein